MQDPYIPLTRSVEAIQIPSGMAVTLAEGTLVAITQALGGAYTVHASTQGGLFRIAARDGDALGKEAKPLVTAPEGPFEEERVWEQLRNCYDPEIPVNIVDLGLVYGLQVADAPEGGKEVQVQMTLTAPGCGMGPSIAADAEHRILSVPGVASARVEVVWDPPWSPERISPVGKEVLGIE